MTKSILIAASLILSALSMTLAQNGAFTAAVDRNQVAVGEQLEVTFTLNGSNTGINFHPPAFDGFIILSGPNASSSFQFINGAMSSSVSYTLYLQAKAEGKYTIGPATIELGRKQLQTQPIAVTVTKGAPRRPG